MEPLALEFGRRFAAALDGEDYAAVLDLLAPTCIYHGPRSVLSGPEAIVASYRAAGELARRLDSVVYSSVVEPGGPEEVVVSFTDRIQHRGASHVYRCRQRLRIGPGGLIEEIRHEELPGERQRLDEFLARLGPE